MGNKGSKEPAYEPAAAAAIGGGWSGPYDAAELNTLLVGLLAVVALAAGLRGRMLGFAHELAGTTLMILCTFSPGPLLGPIGPAVEWPMHVLGVTFAALVAGGAHRNPAVTTAMAVLGKVSPAEAAGKIAAQLVGALAAFPLLDALCGRLGAAARGPEIAEGLSLREAFAGEFAATALLLCAVYGLCLTPLGPASLVRQPLVAAAIRFLIVFYSATGPAMNPCLPSTWAFFSTGHLPVDASHYVVYWVAPFMAAVLTALLWSSAVAEAAARERAQAQAPSAKKRQRARAAMRPAMRKPAGAHR